MSIPWLRGMHTFMRADHGSRPSSRSVSFSNHSKQTNGITRSLWSNTAANAEDSAAHGVLHRWVHKGRRMWPKGNHEGGNEGKAAATSPANCAKGVSTRSKLCLQVSSCRILFLQDQPPKDRHIGDITHTFGRRLRRYFQNDSCPRGSVRSRSAIRSKFGPVLMWRSCRRINTLVVLASPPAISHIVSPSENANM